MAYKIGSTTVIDDNSRLRTLPFPILHAGYVLCGYRDGLLHNKINKSLYSSDTTMTLGATATHIANYFCGSTGPTTGIAWGIGSSGAGGVGHVDSGTNLFTFASETAVAAGTMVAARAYHEAVTYEGQGGYTTGGDSAATTGCDKWLAATNTISQITAIPNAVPDSVYAFTGNAVHGFWQYSGTNGKALAFSNESWSTATGLLDQATYSQALAVSTREQKGYNIGSWHSTSHNSHKNAVNGTAITTSSIGIVPSRIDDARGNSETNALMGNNYARAIGGYSSGTIGQHSFSCKVSHLTDTFIDVSTLDVPNAGASLKTGLYGCSSGATVWV